MSYTEDKAYACLPNTTRGKPTVLGGDPKGKNIVYACGQNIVIRDIENPLICDFYTEHTHNTTVAKYSPSGFYIASGDSVGNVRIWDTVNKEHILKFEMRALAGSVNDIAWSEDSKRIIAVGDGKETFGAAFMFDSGSRAGDITAHSKTILSVDIRQKRKFRAITGDAEPNMGWFEGYPFKWNKAIKEHTRFVNCVRFSPNGDLVISVGSDKLGVLYNADTGDKTGQLGPDGGHKGGIYAVSWSPDSTRVLTASGDKTCKIWDVSSGKCVTTFEMGKDLMDQQVGCLWQGSHLISVGLDGRLTYLDEKNPSKPIRIVYGHNKPVSALGYDPASKSLLSGSIDGSITQWDYATGTTKTFTGKGHTNQVNALEVANGETLVSCAMDDSIRFTPMGSHTFSGDKIATDSPALDVRVAKDMAAAVSMKTITVTKAGKTVATLTPKYAPTSVALSPDGTTVVVGGDDNAVYVYGVSGSSLSEKKKLAEHRGPITAVRYSPDGKNLASSDKSRNIMVWDTSSWEPKQKGWGVFHTATIQALAWSTDSNLLASGSVDSHVIVWNLSKPTSRVTIKRAHKGGVRALAWVDATTLASTGDDATIRTWKIKSE